MFLKLWFNTDDAVGRFDELVVNDDADCMSFAAFWLRSNLLTLRLKSLPLLLLLQILLLSPMLLDKFAFIELGEGPNKLLLKLFEPTLAGKAGGDIEDCDCEGQSFEGGNFCNSSAPLLPYIACKHLIKSSCVEMLGRFVCRLARSTRFSPNFAANSTSLLSVAGEGVAVVEVDDDEGEGVEVGPNKLDKFLCCCGWCLGGCWFCNRDAGSGGGGGGGGKQDWLRLVLLIFFRLCRGFIFALNVFKFRLNLFCLG